MSQVWPHYLGADLSPSHRQPSLDVSSLFSYELHVRAEGHVPKRIKGPQGQLLILICPQRGVRFVFENSGRYVEPLYHLVMVKGKGKVVPVFK
jgi:hypothetical protein